MQCPTLVACATAKRRRPILRVYGEDRSQTVLLALDAGRMMAARLGALTKLDHALQAALLVAHVALRAGDRVGALVFADEVLGYVPPMRGQAHYHRILDGIYDVQARRSYVDHAQLSEFIQLRQRKRALLLVFTDLTDATQARPLIRSLAPLRHKHLPVCVALLDRSLVALAEQPPRNEEEAFVRAAASDLAEERLEVHAQLKGAGIGVVEAASGALALSAVGRYLDIKRRRSL